MLEDIPTATVEEGGEHPLGVRQYRSGGHLQVTPTRGFIMTLLYHFYGDTSRESWGGGPTPPSREARADPRRRPARRPGPRARRAASGGRAGPRSGLPCRRGGGTSRSRKTGRCEPWPPTSRPPSPWRTGPALARGATGPTVAPRRSAPAARREGRWARGPGRRWHATRARGGCSGPASALRRR